MSKTCTKCGESKPLSAFGKNGKLKTGLSSWCKTCHVAATQDWRRRQPKPIKPPEPLLTAEQIELVRLIAKGMDVTEIAAELGIARETVKSRCKRLTLRLGVRRLRETPYAYWLQTGLVPFGPSGFEGRKGMPLGQVVEALFNEKEVK